VQTKKLGLFLFFVGVFLMFVHTALPFLWFLVGIPFTFPLVATEGVLAILPAFTPPIGALLMVIGAMTYGRETGR